MSIKKIITVAAIAVLALSAVGCGKKQVVKHDPEPELRENKANMMDRVENAME